MTLWLGAGLLFWAGVVGGDGADQCFKGSCQPGSVLYYEPGVTYEFLYEGSINFYDAPATPDLQVTALSQVTAVTSCEMILTISQVTLNSHETRPAANPNFTRDLRARELRFSFVDGVVQTVCPSDEETLWSLNFKRAILSLFQNSAGSVWLPTSSQGDTGYVTETEVTGKCTNKYTIGSSKGKDGLLEEGSVTSTRVGSCLPPPVPPTDVVLSTFLQRLPLLRTAKTCASNFLRGRLISSLCTEQFQSSWDSLEANDYLVVSNSLILLNYTTGTPLTSYTGSASLSLMMEFQHQNEVPENWVTETAETINQIAKNLPALDAAYELFTKMRNFNYQKLLDLILQTDAQHWEIIVMLIVKMGTDASNKLVKELRLNLAISNWEMDEIILHVATEYAVRRSLIDIPNMFYLTTSRNALKTGIESHCGKSSRCLEENIWKNVYGRLVKTPECLGNYDDHVVSLKSFGRLGYFRSSYSKNEVLLCMENNDSETIYRALEVLQKHPCESFSYEKVFKLAKSSEKSSFLESMMYLTLIRCPPQGLQPFLLDKLMDEDVNELTSFIWSHLTNSNGTTSFELLKNANLQNKYPPSLLRLSRNFHKTFEFHNQTYTINTNIIFANGVTQPKCFTLEIMETESLFSIIDIKIHQHNDDRLVLDMKIFDHFEYSTAVNRGEFLNFVRYPFSTIFSDLLPKITTELRFGHTIREVVLKYPSMMGMPLHLKANLTTYFPPSDNHMMAAAGTNIQMSLNTPYTEVGRAFATSVELNSFASIFGGKDGGEYLNKMEITLPNIRNSLMTFSVSKYKIKNRRIEFSHVDANDVSHSHCLPWLQDQLGATICLTQYADYSIENSYNRHSSVDIVRGSSIKGFHFIVSGYQQIRKFGKFIIIGDGQQHRVFSVRLHKMSDLRVLELEAPNLTLKARGTVSTRETNINMTGALRLRHIQGDFSFTGTAGQRRNFHYCLKSPVWGSIEVNSTYVKQQDHHKPDYSKLTLTIPYNLTRLNLSDTVIFESSFVQKPYRYEVFYGLKLPMIEAFEFQTSGYVEFQFPLTIRSKLGGELVLSGPWSFLKAKSDINYIDGLLDHTTSLAVKDGFQDTYIVLNGTLKRKNDLFVYIVNLLINENTVFMIRSSCSQLHEVPVKHYLQIVALSNKEPFTEYELTSSSQVDISNDRFDTDVVIAHHGSEKKITLYFGPDTWNESMNHSRTARLFISSDGKGILALTVDWELDPPSDFAVNASLSLPELSVESLSVQAEKEGPHVELTFIEMGGEEEQTYAVEGVLG